MKVFLSLATALALTCWSEAAWAVHYKIWIKAFIPNSGLDIVVPVPGLSGHSMIPGPHIAGIPINSTCYNTNDRSFSSNIQAEAKITMVAEFDVLGPGLANIKTQAPLIGETLRYDCTTGTVIGKVSASGQDITIGNPVFNAGVVTVSFDGEASNPLVSHSPAIKVHGTVRLDTNIKNIGFQGTITRFPAFEAYLSVDNKKAVTLFDIAPDADASPWSLFLTNSINPTVPY